MSSLRNANAHSPPNDLADFDVALGLVRIAGLLREFGLNREADEITQMAASHSGRSSLGTGTDRWSELKGILAGQVDLLDDRIWPRHATTILGADQPLCPYVERDVDLQLESQCHGAASETVRSWEERVIAVVGPPKAGKTRTLVEAIRRSELAERRLVWLVKPGASPRPLAELQSALGAASPACSELVIVVDDLQFHLGVDATAVPYTTVRELAQQGTVLAFTVHPHVLKGLTSIRPSPDAPAGAPSTESAIDPRLVKLLVDRSIHISAQFGEDEAARATDQTGLQQDQVRQLPSLLVSAGLLQDKAASATGLEAAVLHASRVLSLAWPDGVALHRLCSFAREYAKREYGLDPTDQETLRAIDWAATPVHGSAAILSYTERDGDGQVLRLVDHLREPAPLRKWYADPSLGFDSREAVAIALTMSENGFDSSVADLLLADVELTAHDPAPVAYLRARLTADAELSDAHLTRAADRGHPDAMYEFAVRAVDNGASIEEVRTWFVAADQAGVQEAAVDFAEFLLERGRPSEAEDVLRRAAESGNPLAYMPAARLFHDTNRESAARWYEAARSVGDPAYGDCYDDGVTAEQLGELSDAEGFYRRGLSQGDAWCAYGLASLRLRDESFNDEIRALLVQADEGGHPAAALAIAVGSFNSDPSIETAESLVAAIEAADEATGELWDYLESPAARRDIIAITGLGRGDLVARLLIACAPSFTDILGYAPDPRTLNLSGAWSYAVYSALDDERFLIAAAEDGYELAQRELVAHFGVDGEDWRIAAWRAENDDYGWLDDEEEPDTY